MCGDLKRFLGVGNMGWINWEVGDDIRGYDLLKSMEYYFNKMGWMFLEDKMKFFKFYFSYGRSSG